MHGRQQERLDMLQDVRYGWRLLLRRPVFSATAILTLALAIGGTTAVFSLVDALFLRSLPVERPEDLVRLVERRPDGTARDVFTLVTHDRLRGDSAAFSGIAASSQLVGRPGEIELAGRRRLAFVQLVSGNYFEVLGVRAAMGRLFRERQPGTTGEPAAVLSEEYWRRELNADPSVLGTRLRRGSREFTITGVAPAGFRGTDLDVPVDLWVPIDQVVAPDAQDRFRGRWMHIIGRLRAQAARAQASAESTAVLERTVEWQPGALGYSALRASLFRPLLLVAVMAGLVLLIACANLANLMLAATSAREREIALRAAIGASRPRIVRQLFTENLLLAAAGAVLGVGVAYWASGVLLAYLPPEQAVAVPNLRFQLNSRLLGFVVGSTLGTCLLFGVAPAFRASSGTGSNALQGSWGTAPRRRTRIGWSLLAGQVVMCTALLMIAAVFARTVQNLRGQDAGYVEDRVLVATVDFPGTYSETRRDQLIDELRTRAAALPEVEVAAFSHIGQLSGRAIEFRIGFPGQTPPDAELPTVIEQRVSPGFFVAMGTPVLAGRDFTDADDDRAPLVAVVNESFLRRFLQGREAIGARFFRDSGQRRDVMEVVGIVKDSKWLNLRDEPTAMYYRPYRQMGGTPVVQLAVRTSSEPEAMSRELLRLSQSIDSGMALRDLVRFREVVDRTLVTERVIAHVSTSLGLLALLIAGVGLYGVLAYGVARRRRELGVRIALGAPPSRIERMLLHESLTAVAAGIAIGIPAAILVIRAVSSLLFGLSPHDPASIAVAATALLFTATAAVYLPARRAARTDPLAALREE